MLSRENQINLLFFDGFLVVLVGRGWDFLKVMNSFRWRTKKRGVVDSIVLSVWLCWLISLAF